MICWVITKWNFRKPKKEKDKGQINSLNHHSAKIYFPLKRSLTVLVGQSNFGEAKPSINKVFLLLEWHLQAHTHSSYAYGFMIHRVKYQCLRETKPTNLSCCSKVQRTWPVFWRHSNISKRNFIIKTIEFLHLENCRNKDYIFQKIQIESTSLILWAMQPHFEMCTLNRSSVTGFPSIHSKFLALHSPHNRPPSPNSPQRQVPRKNTSNRVKSCKRLCILIEQIKGHLLMEQHGNKIS